MLLYFLAILFLIAFSVTVWWTYFGVLGYKFYFFRRKQLSYLKNNPRAGIALFIFITFYPFLLYLNGSLANRFHAPATTTVVYFITLALFQFHYQSKRVKKTQANKELSGSTKKYLIYFYYLLLGTVVIGLLLFTICMDFNLGPYS